ncbi:unnamed protein product [Rhizophagus irregularis]|nr:unnamed protein product [Rhizophagus irregularis]
MSENVAHALSGAGGGIISMVLTYPLITVSSRLQVQKDTKGADAYKGGKDTIVKILKNEGFRGLYSGLNSAIFGIALTNGVYYYFYESIKAVFEKIERPISVIESMIAGAIAGSATVLVTNPIWVVNTRMTTRKEPLDENEKQKHKKLGTIKTISKIINEDGIKSLWQGVVPALILVINPIIQYTVYEQIKARAISKLVATGSTYPYIVIKSRMQLRQTDDARYKNTWDGLQKIIANEGAGGGIISMVLTYPLITVSSRLQVQKDTKGADAYKGGKDTIVKILKNEGFRGLYSGLNSAIFGIALTNGVYYYFYESIKAVFEKIERPISVIESMIAGAIAGSATVLVTNPIWVVNTRMTTRKEPLDENEKQKHKKLGTIKTISKIINEDGIKSLWQGVVPALILVINPIIQYTVYEQIKARIEKFKELGNLDFFLLGAISKLVATGSTYPYIVIKSRMQLRQTDDARYKNTWDGLQKIIANEGYSGLYKGIASKLLQSVLTAAFLFMYKEALFKLSVKILSLMKIKNVEALFKLSVKKLSLMKIKNVQ